jgi:hypothetical protein
MYTDNEIFAFLLSRQKGSLNNAIGQRLKEVERFFEMDIVSFLEYTPFQKIDFFSRNSGSTKFCFENFTHSFSVYAEQLSIVLLPEPLSTDEFTQSHLVSKTSDELVTSELKSCLGKVCQDVRIWTLQEEFESEEAKEVAISYLFSDNLELFYCTYLHEDLHSDYLLLASEIQREKVATCFSLVKEDYIGPFTKDAENT